VPDLRKLLLVWNKRLKSAVFQIEAVANSLEIARDVRGDVGEN